MRTCFSAVTMAVLLGAIAACGGPEQAGPVEERAPAPEPPVLPAADEPSDAGLTLEQIVAGAHRAEENRARDASRHPVETLKFFGLQPDMTVVEIWPAGGWYTEIIAPYVNDKGKYYAAHWDPSSETEFIQRALKAYQDKLAARPDLYGNAEMTVLMPPEHWDIAPAGSADMVVTFRNIHNWMPRGTADGVFAAMFKALKPGGILGVVEHRGDPNVAQDPKAASGYVNEDYAIELATKAGFVLEATSDVNANPSDTKDYDTGVWTLPPTLRKGDEDRDKYLAIGESDRFTLRFVKPAAG